MIPENDNCQACWSEKISGALVYSSIFYFLFLAARLARILYDLPLSAPFFLKTSHYKFL